MSACPLMINPPEDLWIPRGFSVSIFRSKKRDGVAGSHRTHGKCSVKYPTDGCRFPHLIHEPAHGFSKTKKTSEMPTQGRFAGYSLQDPAVLPSLRRSPRRFLSYHMLPQQRTRIKTEEVILHGKKPEDVERLIGAY
ncbi:hypothetical protein BHE74_00002163 [Ensete ventricosum]|nr:hypothetical protein GW17_00009584 [Ensete ventricosum]RWW88941.1 hypothetical protein BHE74_00002163 [Ensete ventricosum]